MLLTKQTNLLNLLLEPLLQVFVTPDQLVKDLKDRREWVGELRGANRGIFISRITSQQ